MTLIHSRRILNGRREQARDQGCVEGPEVFGADGSGVISDQLELALRMPWDGFDPRSLTRGFRSSSFIRKGTGRPNLRASSAVQLELFPEGTSYGS